MGRTKREHRLSDYIYNPITIIGLGLIIFSIAMIGALQLIQWLSASSIPYGGMVAFVILPPFFLLGLLLVPLGLWRQRKRLAQKGRLADKFFKLDFSIPKHRIYFQGFVILSFVVLMIAVTLSYQAFHYTESVEFCSSCHVVMEPEAVTHQHSPHARVKCVECHVGPGAEWYVRSKMSGLYQVYATFREIYPRPIETPIHNLRPARDTCEQCHWPQFFIDDKVVQQDYFLRDGENTRGSVTLQMHVGGHPEYGRPTGIHWHIANEVYFQVADEKEHSIPWIKVVYADGTERVFRDDGVAGVESPMSADRIHRMDCVDCHNRPSHIFRSPREIMNTLMTSGSVSAALPDIRSVGADLMEQAYGSLADAEQKIAASLQAEYGSLEDTKRAEMDQAIDAILESYKRNFFPYMKARWDIHANHIGHMRSPGCFRCHDGLHVDTDGTAVSRECNLCHTILAQERAGEEARFDIAGVPFQHPEDIGGEWRETSCNECHTGI